MTTVWLHCRRWAGTLGALMIFAVMRPFFSAPCNYCCVLCDYCHLMFVVGLLDHCYAHEIKSVADAMVEQGLDKLGYQYVNMDDCWSATSRDSNGQLQVTSPSSNTHTPSPLFHI